MPAPSPRPPHDQLVLRLLGGFGAERTSGGEIPAKWRRSAGQTLVKLLAVAPGWRRHREEVMDLLWPEAGRDAAIRNLRVTLHAARHALEAELAPRAPSSFLVSEGELLRLVPDRVRVDVDDVEQAALTALSRSDIAGLRRARRALNAELLPENRYEAWAEERRRDMRHLADRVLTALATALVGAGRLESALAVLREAVDESPADERISLLLARTLLDAGLPRQAIHRYHACREALADELGTRPGPEFEELHHAALRTLETAASSAGTAPAVLPPAIRRPERHPLIGRERPLSVLADHAAGRSAVPFAVVRGEAGVGKTRLAAEAARRAAAEGVRVLWGMSHEAEGHTPYGVFADALEGFLADCGTGERHRISAEHPGLASLVPSLGGPPPAAASPEEERARLFRAVSGVLTDLAATHRVLVVLDDLQEADDGSLSLLHQLVRAAQTRPWRFIATWRAGGPRPQEPGPDVLGTLARRELAAQIDLPRLGRADCGRLTAAVAGEVPRRTAARVFELSLGNPLFALELAAREAARPAGRSAGRLADVSEAADAPLAVPDNVRRLVSGRLARLPDGARRTLAVLALAGTGAVSLTELESVTATALHPPLAGAELAAALDAAAESGMVTEREVPLSGRSVLGHAFRHPLVRLTCAGQLSGAARREVHRAYADAALRLRPEAVDLVARHMAAGDDPRAARYLRVAAERAAALHECSSANDYYAQLVERLDAAGDARAAALTRLDWGEVLCRAARFSEGELTLRRAEHELAGLGDSTGALRAAVVLAETLGRAGRPVDGLAVLEEHPAGSSAGPLALAGYHVALAALTFNSGRYSRTLTAVRVALQAVAHLDDPESLALRGRLLVTKGACLLVCGHGRRARAAADEALRLAELSGDARLLSGALSVVGELARQEGRYEQARDCARRAVVTARRCGDPTVLVFDQANLAGAELLLGAYERATALAGLAVRRARSLGRTWALPYALATLAEVHLRCGRLDEADEALRACAASVDLTGDQQVREGMRRIAGELERLRGAGARTRG